MPVEKKFNPRDKKFRNSTGFSAHRITSNPEALVRSPQKDTQTRSDTQTIKWGDNDDLPLLILNAIEESPTTTSCLDVVSDFITGSGFTDPALESIVIDTEGTTLFDLHTTFSESLSKLESFAVNFKYNNSAGIVSAFNVPIETARFCRNTNRKSSLITSFKVNPYFGTELFNPADSKNYTEFDKKKVLNEYSEKGNDYLGQIYYFNYLRSPYKFYSVPKYWTGKKWIYVDGKIQSFHASNLDNGFFQSVLLSLIGDPDAACDSPEYVRKTIIDGIESSEHDGTTVGEDFNNRMSTNFSGHSKAGSVFTIWGASKDQLPTLQAFPTNTNYDVLSGTLLDTIRGITIATKVPAILANLPQQANSLGSDGESFKKATELMHSRTEKQRKKLEQFYNNILLPNLAVPVFQKVKIKPFNPVNNSVTVEDKFWEVLSPDEKRKFVSKNVPGVEITYIEPVNTALPGTTQDVQVNDALKNLKGMQMQNIQRIVRKFNKGEITYEQAAQLLKSGFNFSDNDVSIWLVTAEEE